MSNNKTYDRHINIWINGKEVKNDVSSITKEMLKLTNEVKRATIGSKEHNEKVAELRKVKGILKEHNESIRATGSSWTKVKGMFSGAQGLIVAGLAGLTAGYQSLKGIIFSTDALGDKFTVTVAGWKGGLDALSRSLATINQGGLKDLGKKIREGIDEGRRYAESLDRVDESTRALMIQESNAANELLRQREIQNDVRKSLLERNEAGKQAIQIEEDLAKIRTGIAKQGFENEAKNIASITRLTEAQVMAYVKQEEQMVANIEKGRQYNKMIEDRNALQMMGSSMTGEQKKELWALKDAILNTSEEVKKFGYAAANMPGDEKMQLFVDKYVAYQQAIGSAIENTLRIRTKQANTENQLANQQMNDLENIVATSILGPEGYDADKFIQAETNKLLFEKQINDERQKDYEETERAKSDALISEGERGIKAAEEKWAKMKADDQKNIEDKVLMYSEFGTRIGDIVGNAILEGNLTVREGAKQIINMALNELGNYATIAIAKATVGSMASADSIATFGIAGATKAAVLTGLIKAAVNVAKGVISKNLYTGGYTGPGGKYQPAGIVHAGEWVANQELVSSPQYGPIIQALEQVRLNGYANGGGPGYGAAAAAVSSPSIITRDPRTDKVFELLIGLLSDLKRNGVKTNFDYLAVDNLRKGIDRLEENESDVSI